MDIPNCDAINLSEELDARILLHTNHARLLVKLLQIFGCLFSLLKLPRQYSSSFDPRTILRGSSVVDMGHEGHLVPVV